MASGASRLRAQPSRGLHRQGVARPLALFPSRRAQGCSMAPSAGSPNAQTRVTLGLNSFDEGLVFPT